MPNNIRNYICILELLHQYIDVFFVIVSTFLYNDLCTCIFAYDLGNINLFILASGNLCRVRYGTYVRMCSQFQKSKLNIGI